MPTNEESSFVSPLYLVDTFEELQDLKYSDLQYLEEYRTLKMRKNDGEVVDEVRLAELELIFQNKIVTSSRWNKFQNALLGMQGFIKNEVKDYVVDKQIEMQTYTDTKKTEIQTSIDKFTDKGAFNPDILYYKNNFVEYNDGTGIKTYLAIQNPPLGTLPTNSTYFRLLTITGQKGEDGVGIGLTFKGAWNNSTVYAKDWGVQFGGILFASLIDNNVGNQPDINGDTAAWGIALDVTITTTKLRGQRTIASESNTVNFITGEIIAFNPSVDDLEVIVNTTSVERGIDYTINIDNQSITKASGTWEAGTTFYFRVIRNMINNLVFGDGQSIAQGTIDKTRLTTDVQDTLDSVAENANQISVLNDGIESINTNISENTIKINNHTKEIANLNLQLEVSKRVVSGSTFGTDFSGIFNMTLDYTYTTTNQSLSAGVTDLSDKINTVINGSFIANQRLTITDDVNNEEIIITSISPLTCTPLVNSYKKQALIGRSLVDSNTRNFIDYNEPNDNFLQPILEKTDSVQFTCVKFSPDGTKAFCGGASYLSSKLYDVVSGDLLWSYTPTGNGAGVTCAKFSSDGTKIYVGTAGNTSSEAYIGEINVSTGVLIRKTDSGVTSYVNDLDISPNGTKIAINGGNSGMVFNISDWSSVWTGVATNIKCCCYSKDGTKLAIGFASPYCIKIYNTSDWTLYSNFTTSYQVLDMEFFDNDTKILFCSTISYVYNVTTNSLEHTFTESSIYSVAVNEVDNTLSFCKSDGTNYFYNYPSYTSLGTYKILNGGTHGNMINFSTDGKYFASVNQTTVGTVVRLTVLDTLQNTIKKLLNSVLRFTTQDAKEMVLWVDRDTGLSIGSKINDVAMTKSTLNNQDQFIGELSSITTVNITLNIIRDSTSNNGKINKILGGVL